MSGDVVERAKAVLDGRATPSASLCAELVAEIERLRAGGPWVEHVERMNAMKRERDGDCICDHNPSTTDGPQEDCPWHGRKYGYWVSLATQRTAEVERVRAACKTLGRTIEGQCRMALDASGLHHLIDEDGDGDWGLIWERLAEFRPEIEQLRATIERVRELAHNPATYSGTSVVAVKPERILAALEADRVSDHQIDQALKAHKFSPDGSIWAPESLQQVRDRLALIESTPCMCVDEPHDNALHDLAHDDVPVLLRLIERLQPVRVETVEELDALPADSVVMTMSSRITYQRARTPGQYWYSSALNTCEAKDIGLPALVLWTPPDHIIEQLQEVTR